MEKNIPGLKRQYNICLTKLRMDKPSQNAANDQLTYWSAKYRQLVVSGDNFEPEIGIYDSILNAYAHREALKQYIEEMRQNGEHNSI